MNILSLNTNTLIYFVGPYSTALPGDIKLVCKLLWNGINVIQGNRIHNLKLSYQ